MHVAHHQASEDISYSTETSVILKCAWARGMVTILEYVLIILSLLYPSLLYPHCANPPSRKPALLDQGLACNRPRMCVAMHLSSQIRNNLLHKPDLDSICRADLLRGKGCALGEYCQPHAGLPRASQEPQNAPSEKQAII